jgi:hypothetical protein
MREGPYGNEGEVRRFVVRVLAALLIAIAAAPTVSAEAHWPVPPLPTQLPPIFWDQPCPLGGGTDDSCVLWAQHGTVPIAVYIDDRQDLYTTLHEFGHLQEVRLDPGERNRLARVFGWDRAATWRDEHPNVTSFNETAPSEDFAYAFAECRLSRHVRDGRRTGYDDVPRSVCRLIKRYVATPA